MLAVILAWVFATVAAVVVLGFCTYELHWKAERLHGDAERLQRSVSELEALQRRLLDVQQRIASRGAAG